MPSTLSRPDNFLRNELPGWLCVLALVTAGICTTSASAGSPRSGGGDGVPCPGDANNDNVVNVNDLLMVINGWGACPLPCPPFCAGDVNQSCQVNVTDLLMVINGWGLCPGCPADALEPNNACNQFSTLMNVGTTALDNFRTFNGANLHDSADIDVFRFIAQETDSSCACCDFFCLDEDYRLTVTLQVPAGAGAPYTFAATSPACSTAGSVTVNPGQSGQLIRTFDGSCGGVDSYTIFVHVQANGPTACANYTLTYQLQMGCF